MNTTTMNTKNIIIHEAINDEYEWIQYNNHLRIIRSINDDMYQMNSIINACHSNKHTDDWFRNQSTIEILEEFMKEDKFKNLDETSIFRLKLNTREFPVNRKLIEKRNISPKLKGYYVHRLLVNAIAMWASPRYSVMIFILLDKIATEEREQMTKIIDEQKPRMVPKQKEKNYKYMIWKEDVENEPDMILLHLVRRNNRTFSQVIQHFNNKDENWFYRENLPIAMTPNEDIKQIVKENLPAKEYDLQQCSILTYKEHLPFLHEKISEYFDNFQK